jgi:hypothetical protein
MDSNQSKWLRFLKLRKNQIGCAFALTINLLKNKTPADGQGCFKAISTISTGSWR